MRGPAFDASLAAARDRYDKANEAWLLIGNEIARSSPDERPELEGRLEFLSEYRRETYQELADLQSQQVAETLLERYGEDQEAAICQGKTLAEANEIADANLFERMTGKEHVGDRSDLHGEVAWEMDHRFGEEKAAAYEQTRGDQQPEHAIEQEQELEPEIDR